MVSSSSQLVRETIAFRKGSGPFIRLLLWDAVRYFESLVYPEDEDWLAVYRILVDMLDWVNIGKLPFPDSAISTISTSVRLRAQSSTAAK